MRGALSTYLLRTNPENEEVLALTRETIKDKDNEVNRSALDAFSMAGNEKMNEVRCDVFQENIDHPANEGLAGAAAEFLSQPRFGCMARLDTLLKSIDARVKARKVSSAMFANALRLMCGDKGATLAQMKTAGARGLPLARPALGPRPRERTRDSRIGR